MEDKEKHGGYNVILISTVHHPVGECNHITLYGILKSIRPDVIFEEIPPSLFSKYYLERSKSTLETNAISWYVENFKAVNVPVDSDDIPSGDFFGAYQNAMERVLALDDINGQNFKTLLHTKKKHSSIYGFGFLNSDEHIQYTDEVNNAIEKELAKINDERLILAYQKWNEFGNRRENAMLENIYNYSRAHNYTQAVFLLGASHRKSIKEKIEGYRLNELPKLNWVIYGD